MIWLAFYIAVSIALAFWLRHHFGWAQRLNDCNWRLLTMIDEQAAFLIFTPLYLAGLFPRKPMVGDTVSSLLWFGEWAGGGWYKPVRKAVDSLFMILTSQRDHCAKAYAKWADPMGVS